MAKKAETGPLVIKTAIDLAAEHGWRDLTLARIAGDAGVPLPELYRHFPSKSAILDGFSRMVDEAMLEEGAADPADSARDRLFDLLMRRFDALQAHRAGVTAIAGALRRDPAGSVAQLPQLERSMRWTLEAAGLDSDGLIGHARVRVLGLLYLSVLRVWLKDDTPDMAPTMKALDGRLAQVEQLANTVQGGGRRRRAEAGEATESDQAESG